jgi:hypothetical protein
MTRTNLGMLLSKQGRAAEGLEFLRAASAACDAESPVSSDAVQVARRLGQVLIEAGHAEEAGRVLRTRLSLNPPGPAGELRLMRELLEKAESHERGEVSSGGGG